MTLRTPDVDDDAELPEFLRADRGPAPVAPLAPKTRGTGQDRGHVPGEAGVWIFVLGDMTVFGAIMLALMWERRERPDEVRASAAHLLAGVGFANTLVLLASSYLVACALSAHRAGRPRHASQWIVGALCCAAVFVVLKAVEYTDEIGRDIVPQTNTFFTYYFALTGLHLAHVLVGAVLLSWWFGMSRRRREFEPSRVAVEGVAVYWHMVDLLWIAIFTLVYLVCEQ